MDNPFESHPRVFVVDDEIDIAKMLSVVLQMHLFDAVPFADPREALESARTTPPDYLISDIPMESMAGVELASSFSEEFPTCKVLLFSGLADGAQLVEQANRDGQK